MTYLLNKLMVAHSVLDSSVLGILKHDRKDYWLFMGRNTNVLRRKKITQENNKYKRIISEECYDMILTLNRDHNKIYWNQLRYFPRFCEPLTAEIK